MKDFSRVSLLRGGWSTLYETPHSMWKVPYSDENRDLEIFLSLNAKRIDLEKVSKANFDSLFPFRLY